MPADVRVGLLGAGAWGRNYVRVLGQLGVLSAVCDTDPTAAGSVARSKPELLVTTDPGELVRNAGIGALVIATPAASHFELASAALQSGKHCMVEKPLAGSAAQATELCNLAAAAGVTLMSAHIMLYHPAVRKMKELVDRGDFGEIYYLNATRSNLGTIRREENVIWSLAPHDVSIAMYMLGQPVSVSATAGSYVQRDAGICDSAILVLEFAGGARANIALSWLDPEKVRTVKLVGSQRMALFNDMDPRYKLQIHEKSVDWTQFNEPASGSFLKVRSGDVHFPFVAPDEPLVLECQEFIAAIRESRQPCTTGADGVMVARVLEAAEASVGLGGAPVALSDS